MIRCNVFISIFMTIDQRKIDSVFDNWRRKSFIKGDELPVGMNQERRILFVSVVIVVLIVFSLVYLSNVPLCIIICGVVL